jgi:hypothetical protein
MLVFLKFVRVSAFINLLDMSLVYYDSGWLKRFNVNSNIQPILEQLFSKKHIFCRTNKLPGERAAFVLVVQLKFTGESG